MRLAAVLIVLGEILSLVWLGKWLGVLATLGLLALSGIAGVMLIRRSGLGLMRLARMGRPTAQELSSGAAASLLSGFAGLLLIMPGLVSDVAALLLLLPSTRGWLARLLRFEAIFVAPDPAASPPGKVIDGEAVEIMPPDRRID